MKTYKEFIESGDRGYLFKDGAQTKQRNVAYELYRLEIFNINDYTEWLISPISGPIERSIFDFKKS